MPETACLSCKVRHKKARENWAHGLFPVIISGEDGESSLSYANLIQVNLTNADLSGTDLRSADLFDSNLLSANLEGASLTNTNLFDAKLTCLKGCPLDLPTDYICKPDADCEEEGRFRIVEE